MAASNNPTIIHTLPLVQESKWANFHDKESNNMAADLDPIMYNERLRVVIEFFRNCPLKDVTRKSCEVPIKCIQQIN